MTSKEMSKYVSEQFARERTPETISGSLGISVECMYRTMAADDDKEVQDDETLAESK